VIPARLSAPPAVECIYVMWLKKLFSKPSPPPPSDGPTPDAAAIAEAKRNPNGWVYAMDGIADPNGAVPPERIRGAWKVNANGEIEGEFMPNPNYRPLGGAT
jgi:hypothetical protein